MLLVLFSLDPIEDKEREFSRLTCRVFIHGSSIVKCEVSE